MEWKLELGFSNGDDNHEFTMNFVEEEVPCSHRYCTRTKKVFGVKNQLGQHPCDICDHYHSALNDKEW